MLDLDQRIRVNDDKLKEYNKIGYVHEIWPDGKIDVEIDGHLVLVEEKQLDPL